MTETSYALTNVTTRFKNDGTRVFVTLELAESKPACFYVNYEGLSALVLHLMGATQKMSQTLIASGEAEKYNVRERPISPLHALSCQAGHDPDTKQMILSCQTEEGPLVDLAFPPEKLRELLEILLRGASNKSDEPKGPPIH